MKLKYHRLVRGERLKKSDKVKREVIEGMAIHPADTVPKLRETVESVVDSASKEIEATAKYDEIKKAEMVRDITLSVIGKLHKMWDELPADERVLMGYSRYFVKPLSTILEVARKTNEGIYEMKYGKQVFINKSKEQPFTEWIKGEVVSVEEVKGEDTGTKQDS